jgi:hypothetical protein
MDKFPKKFEDERAGSSLGFKLIPAIHESLSLISTKMSLEQGIAELDLLRVRLRKLNALYTENAPFLPSYEQRRIQEVNVFVVKLKIETQRALRTHCRGGCKASS